MPSSECCHEQTTCTDDLMIRVTFLASLSYKFGVKFSPEPFKTISSGIHSILLENSIKGIIQIETENSDGRCGIRVNKKLNTKPAVSHAFCH